MQAIEELEKALEHLNKAREELKKGMPLKTYYWPKRWARGAEDYATKALELLTQEKEE